jgi:PAS domain S-box-containing protein
MQDARYGYLRWGATAKAKDLDSRYGQLLIDSSSLMAITETPKPDFTVTTTEMGAGEGLDLASVMKASQAISGEIVLDKLLGRLMNIVIENAGAQKGALVLESGGKLLIEAEGGLEQENVPVLHSVPVEESNNLSSAIVNYVARTWEYVVLNNAALEGRFTNDPYILTCRPKSVLCAPIIHKSVLSGILYLENNLITDAFTIERMEMLKLLTSQIATSLENARLYKNLEESELRYRELYENIVDVVILVGANDKILMANPRFYSTIGIPYTTGKEFTFKKWVHADDVLQVEKQMLPRLLDGSEVKDFEFRIVNKHGMVFDVECNAKRIKKGDELVGFQMVIRDITERKRLANKLIESLKDIENARSGTILGLAKLAEYRDEETGAHLERIREYARIIARALAEKPKHENYITEQYIEDIGGDVLKAVNEEVGGRSFVTLGMEIAYFHHEKWNGTGYPNGLKGEDIPLSARIVALTDVYDALTSKRVYKEAYTHEKARGIIIAENGKHFDPEVVEAFLANEDEFNTIRKEKHNET